MMKCFWQYEYPVGRILLAEDSGYIVGLYFAERSDFNPGRQLKDFLEQESALIKEAANQLDEYFSGKRHEFDLPLKFIGTDFQKEVWEALMTIPYGETKTYSGIAAQIGNPKACRAVGMANNQNPISIICPCHRVVGKGGSLIGYGGGLDAKQLLLDLETGQLLLDIEPGN